MGCYACVVPCGLLKPTNDMKPRIYLSLARMSGREREFIDDAFATDWIAPLGPNVDGFESDLEEYLATGENPSFRVAALSSGTAALHLALLALGVGPGDEVICQSFTFAASANPIRYVGADPVFVDSEPGSWNMDPLRLEEAILDRLRIKGSLPAAIIPVHLYGMPARMDAILEIASRYGIPVVEDAAEALGSRFDGRPCGTLGRYGALSFNGNKIITTSGGGALVCPDGSARDHTLFLATQARDQAPWYQHSSIGYNYRLSNVCAGIGRGQMTVLNAYVQTRRAINRYYAANLSVRPGFTFQCEPDPRFRSNFWLTALRVDPELAGGITPADICRRLEAENIEARHLWKPMHLQPVFADAPYYGGDVCETLFRQGVCLPSGPLVTHADQDRIIEILLRL